MVLIWEILHSKREMEGSVKFRFVVLKAILGRSLNIKCKWISGNTAGINELFGKSKPINSINKLF